MQSLPLCHLGQVPQTLFVPQFLHLKASTARCLQGRSDNLGRSWSLPGKHKSFSGEVTPDLQLGHPLLQDFSVVGVASDVKDVENQKIRGSQVPTDAR